MWLAAFKRAASAMGARVLVRAEPARLQVYLRRRGLVHAIERTSAKGDWDLVETQDLTSDADVCGDFDSGRFRAALVEALAQARTKYKLSGLTPVDVLLGSRWAPAMCVELGDGPVPPSVVDALVRQRWIDVWGAAAADWPVQIQRRHDAGRVLSYACNASVIEALVSSVRDAGLGPLRCLRPSLDQACERVAVLEEHLVSTRARDNAWLLSCESDRTVALRLEQGRPIAHVVLAANEDTARAETTTMLDTWDNRLGLVPGTLVLQATVKDWQVKSASIGKWTWIDYPLIHRVANHRTRTPLSVQTHRTGASA